MQPRRMFRENTINCGFLEAAMIKWLIRMLDSDFAAEEANRNPRGKMIEKDGASSKSSQHFPGIVYGQVG